jgi:hypothetical protein
MPNKDKTGPNEKGSKTGRQLGGCSGAHPILRGSGSGCRGQRRKNCPRRD